MLKSTNEKNTFNVNGGPARNILDSCSLEQAFTKAKKNIKEDNLDQAKSIYQDILKKFPKNQRAASKLKLLKKGFVSKSLKRIDPPLNKFNQILDLYKKREFRSALDGVTLLLTQYAGSSKLHNLHGTIYGRLGQFDDALEAYRRALTIDPGYAEAFCNLGNALRELGLFENASEAYRNALKANPKFLVAYHNLGGIAYQLGRPKEALALYQKALSLSPHDLDTHYNLAGIFKNLGMFEECIKAYKRVLHINFKHSATHRHLSSIQPETQNSNYVKKLKAFYQEEALSQFDRCNLSFALANLYTDYGDYEEAIKYLTRGNTLRKNLLGYEIDQDKTLFSALRRSQPIIKESSLQANVGRSEIVPIFILGMPRSGTTLIEQIVSSHSEVMGAGELSLISDLGGEIANGTRSASKDNIENFRTQYLLELSNLADGAAFVVDKMPQNFRFIPLIVAAFPEAKIVHIKRDAKATCWSNYSHYFAQNGLGYCYDLQDTVAYYQLYNELMTTWKMTYNDRIYELDYDVLTINQEEESRKLIRQLGLVWQDVCLFPEKNSRAVSTASAFQIRKKIYKGSSRAWQVFEPFLNGAFENISASSADGAPMV